MVFASQEDMRAMLAAYDAWVFDCDGTLWKGSELIAGCKEALQLLRDAGKRVIFVTNNSTKSRAAFKKKFDELGLHATPDEVFSSSFSAAAYLKSRGFSKKAYVVGERGIMDELALAGIEALGGPDDNGKQLNGKPVDVDPEIGAVVCGVDPGLSYYKIAYASVALLADPDCLFVATNTDSRGHFHHAQEWPGAGATVGAVRAVVEREPIVTGKPAPFLLEHVMRTHQGTTPARMIMVGDRLDTDIAFGRDNGMGTLLVLTGVVTEEAYAAAAAAAAAAGDASSSDGGSSGSGFQRPDYVLRSFGDLLQVLKGD